MSIQRAKEYLSKFGEDKNIQEFNVSSATTEDAANAVNCKIEQIGKTLSFKLNDRIILIVVAGDIRVDNAKFKAEFGKRGSMIPHDKVEEYIGHFVGGVCPFGINENIEVYLDTSIKRSPFTYVAAGSSNSLIKLSIPKLEEVSNYLHYVDIGKPYEQE